jgi:hypothetical protein
VKLECFGQVSWKRLRSLWAVLRPRSARGSSQAATRSQATRPFPALPTAAINAADFHVWEPPLPELPPREHWERVRDPDSEWGDLNAQARDRLERWLRG